MSTPDISSKNIEPSDQISLGSLLPNLGQFTLNNEEQSWVADFASKLSDQVQGLKGNEKAAYDDLEFYSRFVMGEDNIEYTRNSSFLRNIYWDWQYTNDDMLVLGPRGSAKSTAVTITSTTWEIGRNPAVRALLAFASMEAQGLAFARQLDHIITKNERYISIFGELKPQKPEKWDESEKIVRRSTPPSGLKDPTIAVVGLGSAVPSKRADIVVCDDLVTMENAYSDIQRAKVIRFVFQTLFPILVPGGRRVIIGSRWDERDLYAHTATQWGLQFPEPVQIDLGEIISHAVTNDLVKYDDKKFVERPIQ